MIQLLDIRRHAESGHRVEYTKGVTSLEQLMRISLVKCPESEEDDVVDHVGIGDVIEEGGKGFDSVGSKVVEFGDHLLSRFVGDGRG